MVARALHQDDDPNSGAASGQRARNSFSDRTQANYDTETTDGIAYRGIEFYECAPLPPRRPHPKFGLLARCAFAPGPLL